MDEQRSATQQLTEQATERPVAAWMTAVVGLALFGLIVGEGIVDDGVVPNVAFLFGLLGIALTAVGLNVLIGWRSRD